LQPSGKRKRSEGENGVKKKQRGEKESLVGSAEQKAKTGPRCRQIHKRVERIAGYERPRSEALRKKKAGGKSSAKRRNLFYRRFGRRKPDWGKSDKKQSKSQGKFAGG